MMKVWYHPVPKLDDEIYVQLVDQLFGTVGALAAAIAGSVAMASAGVFLDGRPRFHLALLALAVACAARVLVFLAYRQSSSDKKQRRAMARWEVWYGASAITWMAVIGCDAYLSMSAPSMLLRIFASIMAMGLTGGIAARNASRPWIVKVQVVALLGPYSCALLQIGGYAYLAMLAMSLFMFAGVVSATETFYRLLVTAMETANRNTFLARRLDTALNNMSHGLVMFDNASNVEVVNAKFWELLGVHPSCVRPNPSLQDVVHYALAHHERPLRSQDEFVELFQARMSSMCASELLIQTNTGTFYDFKFHPTADGGSVISMEDVTEKRTAAAKIERLAHFDELSDLPNRAMFKEKLASLVLDPAAVGTFALHLLDLDAFKQVNDTLGHPIGDALLAMVSRRIKGALRADDFCARLAGDEFVVVQNTAGETGIAVTLASRMIEIISQPYSIDGQDIVIGVSVGIVASEPDGASAEDLLKHVDLALYRAKQTGKGTFCFFEPGMIGEANDRRNLEHDLRLALRADEIEVFFQPIVDVHEAAVVSFEALARWRHPARGIVGPNTFISVAEATGLIIDLGAIVLRKACQAATTWPGEVTVSVNLSVAQFRKGVVVEQIKEALECSGLPPTRLEVEVTESLALDNLATTHDMIGQMRALGVRVALDDFGTGYSSLAYLQQIPFDKIKIDRSFVRSIVDDGMSRSLVRLMTSFACGLDKTLVVEGVETAEQAAVLRGIGVVQMQGFLFGAPQPTVAFDVLSGLQLSQPLQLRSA